MIAEASVWREVRASYAFVERNMHLSKRYWGWEAAYLLYTVAQSASVLYIPAGLEGVSGKSVDMRPAVLFLAIGALTWSYMANLFLAIAESVQWERWEGTIEYSMMAPISILTYILGSSLFGVIYGLIRTTVVLILIVALFHLQANQNGFAQALVIVSAGSLSFVGVGIMAATLPLLFTEKGAQMTYVIEACLLLVSGVYVQVDKLPAWMQPISHISPATYVLQGTREVLSTNPSWTVVVDSLIPLLIIGAITIPLGLWMFIQAEQFAKRTGRLKRTG